MEHPQRRRSESKSISTSGNRQECPSSRSVFLLSRRDSVPPFLLSPRACAVGCILSPLCGWGESAVTVCLKAYPDTNLSQLKSKKNVKGGGHDVPALHG
jgi:hypothetical protein